MLGALRQSVTSAVLSAATSRRAVEPRISVSSPLATESDYKQPEVMMHKFFTTVSVPQVNGAKFGMHLSSRYNLLTCRHFESTAATADASKPHEYQANVSRLMDLIVHRLCNNKEVFLRELVSNASDALGKLHFLSVTES